MKTVGDVVNEIDTIQTAIQNLHTFKLRMLEEDQDRLNDVIILLSHYRNVLYAIPINK